MAFKHRAGGDGFKGNPGTHTLLCKRIPESRLYLFLIVKANLRPPKKVISYLEVESLCSVRTMDELLNSQLRKNFKNFRDTYVKLPGFNLAK